MDWRDRFRAGQVLGAAIARRNPGRGLVLSDRDGNEEAYAWDAVTGELRRLTDAGTAVLEAAASPDGASIVYLRDGFSYELKELVDLDLKGLLTFECEPVDDQYKVGAFIVSMLFEEIVRVENFAVHPTEQPEDIPLITGFRTSPNTPQYAPEPPPREQPSSAA